MSDIARSRSVTEQTTHEFCGMRGHRFFRSAISASYVFFIAEYPSWHRYCDTSPQEPCRTRARMVHVTFDTSAGLNCVSRCEGVTKMQPVWFMDANRGCIQGLATYQVGGRDQLEGEQS
jgi:hypothetical protein